MSEAYLKYSKEVLTAKCCTLLWWSNTVVSQSWARGSWSILLNLVLFEKDVGCV